MSNLIPAGLQFGEEAGESDESDAPIVQRSTTGETLAAKFELAWESGPFKSGLRSIQIQKAQRYDDVTHHDILNEELNPDVPWTEPTSRAKAEKIIQYQEERKALERVILYGQTEGPTNFLLGFGAELLGSGIDPVGIAAGVLTAGGTHVAATTGLISKSFLISGSGKALGATIAEGVVGNTLSEALLVLPNQRLERRDVDEWENISNVILSSIAFPVAFSGIKFTAKKIKQFHKGEISFSKLFEGKPKEEMGVYAGLHDYTFEEIGKFVDLTEAKMNQGKRPDLTPEEVDLIRGVDPDSLHRFTDKLEAMKKQSIVSIPWKNTKEKLEFIKELDLLIEQTKSTKQAKEHLNFDPVEMREKANSPEEDMYNDKETAHAIATIDESDLQPVSEKIKKDIEELHNPELVPKEKRTTYSKKVKDVTTRSRKKSAQVSEIYKLADKCD